ncbi:MAG: hypothetical protein HY283_07885 [Nitrospirae bacterium]|nr:hypothetical protein [Nitrospirota bacterium]
MAGLVTIIDLPIVLYQLSDLKTAKYDRSTQLLVMFDQEFYSGSNQTVTHALEHEGPLLKKNGGRITEEQLGDYLDVMESLSDVYHRGVIDKKMFADWEGRYIEEAYNNKEVREYIFEQQKDDLETYTHFEAVAKQFIKEK